MKFDLRRQIRVIFSRVRQFSCRIKVIGVNLGSGKPWAGLPFWYAYDAEEGELFTGETELPFSENSVELLFSSHFIEHLNIGEAEHLLKEAFRILKPGGKFRIICPDIELLANAVFRGENTPILNRPSGWGSSELALNAENIFLHFACHYELYSEGEGSSVVFRGPPRLDDVEARRIAELPVSEIWSSVEKHVPELGKNSIQHRSCWSSDILKKAAVSAGFQFERSGYGLARSKTWQFFDFTHGRREISLYAELSKPTSMEPAERVFPRF